MATITRYTTGLQNQTTGLPMPSQAATILTEALVPAVLYTNDTGTTILSGIGLTSSTPQANLIFFADSEISDNYVVRVAGQVDVVVPLPAKSSALVHTKDPARERLIDTFAGVDWTGATDCGPAINTALAAFSAAGGGMILLNPLGRYKTSVTILAPSNVHVEGGWGGIAGLSPSLFNGAMFLWIGATNTPVIKFNNVQFARWRGFGVDGGATIAGVTGILIDSTNALRTDDVVIEDYYIQRCGTPNSVAGTAVRWGTGAGSPQYQSDRCTLGRGYIYACAKGLVVNSDNAADCSTVGGPLTIDAFETAVEVISCGNMSFDRVLFGGGFGFPTRSVTDLVTNSTRLVTSATANWTDADVGAVLTAAGVPTSNYIVKVISSTNAYMSQPATATASGVTCGIQRVGTCIKLSGRWNPISFRGCQAEGDDVHFRVMPGATPANGTPISFMGANSLGKVIVDQQCQIMSMGNAWFRNIWLNTDYVDWVFLDSFTQAVAPDLTPNFQLGSGATFAGIFAPAVPYAGLLNAGYLQATAGALPGAIKVNYQGVAFNGNAPVPKAAHPTVLADVITILQNAGLCA